MAEAQPHMDRIPKLEVVITEPFTAPSVPRLTVTLAEALRVNPIQLVVNLSACPAIDDAGIAVLLETHRHLRRAGGYLTVRGPAEHLRRDYRLAHSDRVPGLPPLSARSDRPEDSPHPRPM